MSPVPVCCPSQIQVGFCNEVQETVARAVAHSQMTKKPASMTVSVEASGKKNWEALETLRW